MIVTWHLTQRNYFVTVCFKRRITACFGFLVHKDIVNTVMGCRPVSSRLITIRLRASPFNITIIQAYAPTSDYDDDAVEVFYDHLQEILDQSPKKDILVVLGDWNAKVGEDAFKNWKGTCGRYCNPETNERGLRLLEFACYNDLVLACVAGVRKGRGRELGRETTREGGGRRRTPARKPLFSPSRLLIKKRTKITQL